MTSTLTYSYQTPHDSLLKAPVRPKTATRLSRRNGKNPVMAILKIIYQQNLP